MGKFWKALPCELLTLHTVESLQASYVPCSKGLTRIIGFGQSCNLMLFVEASCFWKVVDAGEVVVEGRDGGVVAEERDGEVVVGERVVV